jgi:hypothetical protein
MPLDDFPDCHIPSVQLGSSGRACEPILCPTILALLDRFLSDRSRPLQRLNCAARFADSPPLSQAAELAYADPLGHAPEVLACLREAAALGDRDREPARHFGAAAFIIGAFDLALPLLRTAVDGLRAEGRLGHLPMEPWPSVCLGGGDGGGGPSHGMA